MLKMKLNSAFLFSLIFSTFLLSSCKKDEVNGNGMGHYTGPYIEQPPQTSFTLTGQLKYCNEDNIGVRQITLYEGGNLNILYDGETDEQGNFNIIFAGNRPAYAPGHEISPPNILSILEDSTHFVLPGLTDLADLELVVGDSFEVEVQLKLSGDNLTNLDTIFYDFVRLEYAFQELDVLLPAGNIAYGPINQDTVLKKIRRRWDIIEVDEFGTLCPKIFWKKRTPTSVSSANYYSAKSTKTPCVDGLDFVEIKWK